MRSPLNGLHFFVTLNIWWAMRFDIMQMYFWWWSASWIIIASWWSHCTPLSLCIRHTNKNRAVHLLLRSHFTQLQIQSLLGCVIYYYVYGKLFNNNTDLMWWLPSNHRSWNQLSSILFLFYTYLRLYPLYQKRLHSLFIHFGRLTFVCKLE